MSKRRKLLEEKSVKELLEIKEGAEALLDRFKKVIKDAKKEEKVQIQDIILINSVIVDRAKEGLKWGGEVVTR